MHLQVFFIALQTCFERVGTAPSAAACDEAAVAFTELGAVIARLHAPFVSGAASSILQIMTLGVQYAIVVSVWTTAVLIMLRL